MTAPSDYAVRGPGEVSGLPPVGQKDDRLPRRKTRPKGHSSRGRRDRPPPDPDEAGRDGPASDGEDHVIDTLA